MSIKENMSEHHLEQLAANGDILLVEDNMFDLKLMSSILQKAGYQLRSASNSTLALRSIQAKTPALILMDIHISGMNGLELCRQIKSDSATRDLPIIFISAMNEISFKLEAFEAGGVDYITKPFESAEVLARVGTHLKISQLQYKMERQREELLAEVEDRELAERKTEELARFPSENPSPVLRINNDGILIFANKSSSVILETWKIQERERVPERWVEIISEVSRSGQTKKFDEEIDGRTFSFTLSPIKEMDYVNAYGMDITESIVAKNSLKANEQKYGELIHVLNSGIVIHAPDTSIIMSNPKAQEILGLTENQMLGKEAMDPYWQFIRDDETVLPLSEYPVSRIISSKKEISNIVLGIRKPETKNITWVLVSGFPLIDEKNNLQQVIITFIDITDHKNAEIELELYRKELESLVEERTADLAKLTKEQRVILDSVRASIFYKDTDNNIVKVNKAAAESLGMRMEDIEGHSCCELFPEEAEKYYQDDIEVIQSRKAKLGIVEPLRTVSGEKMWILTDKIPYIDEDGNITGVIVFSIDITKRKKTEEALQERYSEVNNLNKAMINLLEDYEIAKNNLLKSQSQLEMSNRELESFSYSVSHDLRAPLRGIDGFSQIIMEDYEDKLDDQGKDYLQRIRNASTRMGALIDDLLRLSHISRANISLTKINLSEIADDVAIELKKSHPCQEVDFSAQRDVFAEGDPQLLKIALENLLGNAWKFCGRVTSAKIEFAAKKDAETQKMVYYIKDNGVGFDMRYADKLFGAFQRLHSSEEFEGTGIGLATVKRIVSRHNGSLWAEGKIDEGATFYFTLG